MTHQHPHLSVKPISTIPTHIVRTRKFPRYSPISCTTHPNAASPNLHIGQSSQISSEPRPTRIRSFPWMPWRQSTTSAIHRCNRGIDYQAILRGATTVFFPVSLINWFCFPLWNAKDLDSSSFHLVIVLLTPSTIINSSSTRALCRPYLLRGI